MSKKQALYTDLWEVAVDISLKIDEFQVQLQKLSKRAGTMRDREIVNLIANLNSDLWVTRTSVDCLEYEAAKRGGL